MFRAISSFFSFIGETISSGLGWLRDRFKGGGREEEEEDEEEDDDVYLGDDDVGEEDEEEDDDVYLGDDDVGEVENIEQKNLRGPFVNIDDAEEYASDIPVPTFIIYDDEDDLWYVVIDYER